MSRRDGPGADSHDDSDTEFFALWAQHQSMVFAYLVSLVTDPDDAADVLQETAITLWKKRDRYDRTSRFTTWACGVARLEAFRFMRERRKSGIRFSEDTLRSLADRLETRLAEEPAFIEDRRRALSHCLQCLDEQQRELLKVRYVEGVSTATLAQLFGLSVDSLYAKLKRIRARLATCIEHQLRQSGHQGYRQA
ncbi:MAG: sigma-70 family RNA polymerase sigma factor [Planctomycetota bacterium]